MPNVRGWLLVFIVSIFVCSSATAALSSPWQNADVGSVGLAGSTLTADGMFTVTGSGADIWGTSDAFQYVYQPLNGDGEIIAHVASEQNPDAWSKAGVMFRETLDSSSSHALIAVTHPMEFHFNGAPVLVQIAAMLPLEVSSPLPGFVWCERETTLLHFNQAMELHGRKSALRSPWR